MLTIPNKVSIGGAESQTFGSFAITLKDDESCTLKLPIDAGHVLIAELSSASHGMAWVRGSSAVKYFGGNKFAVLVNTPLLGTTGEDGFLTISTSAGDFYLENRTGVTIEVSVTFLGITADRI